MSVKSGAIGIIVSGGPAPGINCVISSAVREATKLSNKVYGFDRGFMSVLSDTNPVIPLTLPIVSESYKRGGSILGTSRFNPFRKQSDTNKLRELIDAHQINKLIVIGGEGSAYLSHKASNEWKDLAIAHVPKTIDNDLILPNEHPSFGFETARSAGTNVLNTLATDAKTCQRWFIVTSMGRKAGFLALGIGIASGATLTIIPEEFEGRLVHVDEVVDIIFKSIELRLKSGKAHGVAVLAEGIIDLIDPDSDPMLAECPRDELGRIRYSDVELGDVVVPKLKQRCLDANLSIHFNTKNIGYELRCHDPISFDIEYTTFLGYGAVHYLSAGKKNFMITREFDCLGVEYLDDMITDSGGIRSRKVNLDSDQYKIARSFMARAD